MNNAKVTVVRQGVDVGKVELSQRKLDFIQLYEVLRDEIQALMKDTPSDLTNVTGRHRRVLIRSFFSFMEAMVYSMKSVAADSARTKVSAPDSMIVSETSYQLDESGHLRPVQLKLRLTDNIRYAFRLFKESFGIAFDLEVSGEGWQCFKRSIKIRDRLTHPKTASDISVSDSEFKEAVDAFTWFQVSFGTALHQAFVGPQS